MKVNQLVTIFSRQTFLCHYLVKNLIENGFLVKIVTDREAKFFEQIKTQASIGRISVVDFDINDSEKFASFISGSDVVINLIDCMYQKNKSDFTYLNSQFPEILAKVAKNCDVARFIHLSHFNIDSMSDLYGKSKAIGDKAAIGVFQGSTIIRSSVIYGEEDEFFNNILYLCKKYNFFPMFSDEKIKFQPIYVGDFCKAVANVCQSDEIFSGVYEVGGNEIITLLDLHNIFERVLNKKIKLLKISNGFFGFITKIFNWLPLINKLFFGSNRFLFSPEQIQLMQKDSTITNDEKDLMKIFDIKTDYIESNIEKYLS